MIRMTKFRWGAPLAALLVSTAVGCASASTTSVGAATVKHDGADRNVDRAEELAALLNDNEFAIAARKQRAGSEDALAAEKASDEAARKKDAEEAANEKNAEQRRLAAEAAMKRAEAALDARDFDAAAKAAREAIDDDPKGYPYAYVILGDTYLEAHDYQKALESYQQAMKLDPNDGWAVNRASQAMIKLKRPNDARDALRKFVADHADADADTLDALAWLELDSGDAKAAEKAFERAEKVSAGKDPEAWYGLAMLAARRKDTNAVAKDLEALFALEPERRLVLERDPTFFRARMSPNVKALFSPQKMAEAKQAADGKKSGLAVGGGPSVDKAIAAASSGLGAGGSDADSKTTKLAVPGGGDKTIAEQIRFDFDSATIKAESAGVVAEIADFLAKEQKGIDFVEIEGHADKVGDDAYNVRLSEARARAVRDALVAKGIPASKLLTKGYGNFCPVDGGDDAKNRRVQFAIGAGGKVFGDGLTCNEKMRKWLKPNKLMSVTQ